MVERNDETPEDERVRFRIGINVGDVMEQDGDLLARISQLSRHRRHDAAPHARPSRNGRRLA